MSIDAKESVREGTDESLDTSTPEAETEIPPENVGQQKRKGGRKPIYATSEERKQRNRQAQAAFRERRTEYIKQLEETIRIHETNLHNLQNAHRSAADECLMLRYKNSLLERILLEKGIDVQAELRAKTGSPHLGPTHMQQNMAHPPTFHRAAAMNRHHQARRSNSNIAPKLEPGVSFHNPSSQSRPTPSSHASSPTTNSPGFNNQGVLTPPSSDSQVQHQQQQQQRLHAAKTQAQHALSGTTGLLVNTSVGSPLGAKVQGNGNGTGNTGSAPVAAAYYPSFQNHIEQLGKLTQQEYDAQTDMVDDQPEIAGPGPYPESIPAGQLNQQQRNQQQQLGHPPHSQGMHGDNTPQAYSSMAQLLDPFDAMLDMDPFGLTASMNFPTQFTFDTSSMR
ncbi:hypothetical protein SBOR_2719 [Sclerotinia borealis F-4128]|uniref:BZIP domain-containing protein n=1 Tax=Sclerotinia borealis (strain F-4128) TaxID=1432307 RepID=W9CR22_SCLBF|nr:hypothetical protein SBOR_2719 [Sclerotinia borealis F-4128]